MEILSLKKIGSLDLRVLLLGVSALAGAVYVYQAFKSDSYKDAISNAANEYAPLVRECIDKRTSLECLAQLKIVADAETFEAAKKVALAQ